MTNYFLGLAERTLGLRETLQPSIASMFEPGTMLVEDYSEENSEAIEQPSLPLSEAQFFFRSSPLKPNSEIELKQGQQARGKPLPGFGLDSVSGSSSLRLEGIVPPKSPTRGGLQTKDFEIERTKMGSQFGESLEMDEVGNGKTETVLLGNVQGRLSRIDADNGLFVGNLSIDHRSVSDRLNGSGLVPLDSEIDARRSYGLFGWDLSIDERPLSSRLRNPGLVPLDPAINLGQFVELNSQSYRQFEESNSQPHRQFERPNLQSYRRFGEWNSQLYKQSVPPHTNSYSSQLIRGDEFRAFGSKAGLGEAHERKNFSQPQMELEIKVIEYDGQTARSALTPNPSPKMGEGSKSLGSLPPPLEEGLRNQDYFQVVQQSTEQAIDRSQVLNTVQQFKDQNSLLIIRTENQQGLLNSRDSISMSSWSDNEQFNRSSVEDRQANGTYPKKAALENSPDVIDFIPKNFEGKRLSDSTIAQIKHASHSPQTSHITPIEPVQNTGTIANQRIFPLLAESSERSQTNKIHSAINSSTEDRTNLVHEDAIDSNHFQFSSISQAQQTGFSSDVHRIVDHSSEQQPVRLVAENLSIARTFQTTQSLDSSALERIEQSPLKKREIATHQAISSLKSDDIKFNPAELEQREIASQSVPQIVTTQEEQLFKPNRIVRSQLSSSDESDLISEQQFPEASPSEARRDRSISEMPQIPSVQLTSTIREEIEEQHRKKTLAPEPVQPPAPRTIAYFRPALKLGDYLKRRRGDR